MRLILCSLVLMGSQLSMAQTFDWILPDDTSSSQQDLIWESAVLQDKFKQADALFAQRDHNLTAIAQAKSLYESIIDHSSSNIERSRALDQLGKLVYYEGDLLTETQNSARRQFLFSR